MTDDVQKPVMEGVVGDQPMKRFKLIAIILAVAAIVPVAMLIVLGLTVFADDEEMRFLFPLMAGLLFVVDMSLAAVLMWLDMRQRKGAITLPGPMVVAEPKGEEPGWAEPLRNYTRIEMRRVGRSQTWFLHALHPDAGKCLSSVPYVGRARADIEAERVSQALGGITIAEAPGAETVS